MWAFGVAIGCVAVAVAVRWLAGIVDPQIPPFVTIFAAILITTIFAGALAGIVASAAGLAMTWAAFAVSIPTAFTPTSLALYALASAGIVWVSEQYRALLESAEFFFIDGPKDGKTEYTWMRLFKTLDFKNVVFNTEAHPIKRTWKN